MQRNAVQRNSTRLNSNQPNSSEWTGTSNLCIIALPTCSCIPQFLNSISSRQLLSLEGQLNGDGADWNELPSSARAYPYIYPYIPAPLPNAQCHAPTTRAVRLFLLQKLRQFCLYVACGVAFNASYLAMENLHLLKHFLGFFFLYCC